MHDLIEQIEDKRERERFRQVWEESIREKKFGLVFEPHLPELLPLPKVKPRRGDLVCMRDGSLKNLWRVRRVANGVAFCVKPGAEGQGGPVDAVQLSLGPDQLGHLWAHVQSSIHCNATPVPHAANDTSDRSVRRRPGLSVARCHATHRSRS